MDIYQGVQTPALDPRRFCQFILFFPYLLAGPIERAGTMIPQFDTPRQFNHDKIYSGIGLIALGFFKKLAISDNLAFFSDPVFNHMAMASLSDILISTGILTFQIFFDFAGYTDIARGVSRTLGFELRINFPRRRPYPDPESLWLEGS